MRRLLLVLVVVCLVALNGRAFAQSQGVGVTVTQSRTPGPTSNPGPTQSPGSTSSPGSTLSPGATLVPTGGGIGGPNVLGTSTGPGGDLPKTGVDIAFFVALALALIACGALLAGAAERRRRLAS